MEFKEVVTYTAYSDCGSSYGYLEGVEGHTLREVLDYYKDTSRDWGVVCIYMGDKIIRKFDYNLSNKDVNVFFHHLGAEYKYLVKEVKFNFCHMNRDIDIYLDEEAWERKREETEARIHEEVKRETERFERVHKEFEEWMESLKNYDGCTVVDSE